MCPAVTPMTLIAETIPESGDSAAQRGHELRIAGWLFLRKLIVAGAGNQFCCTGCEAVYQTLHACGLESYYRLRDGSAARRRPAGSSFERDVRGF